jgi:hypothetical protein
MKDEAARFHTTQNTLAPKNKGAEQHEPMPLQKEELDSAWLVAHCMAASQPK